MRVCKMAMVIVCGLWVAACGSLLPKPFTPTTSDEQAVARTADAFLTAVRAHDAVAMQRLLAPEATVTRVADGVVVVRGPYSESSNSTPALLSGGPVQLVNFQQPAIDRAAVQTYIVTYPEGMTQVTHLRWDLARRDGMWRIVALREISWARPDHIPVYGTP